MELSERIKTARKKRGITQAELSKITGISAGMIGHYETGYREPPIAALELLANALDVPEHWLMGEKLYNASIMQAFISPGEAIDILLRGAGFTPVEVPDGYIGDGDWAYLTPKAETVRFSSEEMERIIKNVKDYLGYQLYLLLETEE